MQNRKKKQNSPPILGGVSRRDGVVKILSNKPPHA